MWILPPCSGRANDASDAIGRDQAGSSTARVAGSGERSMTTCSPGNASEVTLRWSPSSGSRVTVTPSPMAIGRATPSL